LFTFVIPAHNEEATVAAIVGQARAAAGPGDRILVVDSASTDDGGDGGLFVVCGNDEGEQCRVSRGVRSCTTLTITRCPARFART
jgi:hypothetical protein